MPPRGPTIAPGAPDAPYATDGPGGAWLSVFVPAVPHPDLTPHRRVDPRTAAKRRRALREAADLATHNALVAHPWLVERFAHGRLTLIYTVYWPRGRRHWDGDNMLAALKGATDGFAQKLGISDAGFAFRPVEQSGGQGRGFVSLVVHERPDDDG